MNKRGEHVPTAWIWLIPFFGGIWWLWKYSEAVGHVTEDRLGSIFAFILLFFLGCIGQAIIQDFFNKIGSAPAGAPATPAQPGQPGQPMSAAPVPPQSSPAPDTSTSPAPAVPPTATDPAPASPATQDVPPSVPPAPQTPPTESK